MTKQEYEILDKAFKEMREKILESIADYRHEIFKLDEPDMADAVNDELNDR